MIQTTALGFGSYEAMEHRAPNLYHDMVGRFLAPGEECAASTRVSGDDGIGCAAQSGKEEKTTKDDPVWLEPGEWRSNQKAGKVRLLSPIHLPTAQ